MLGDIEISATTVWLILFVAFLLIEILTMGLTTIWFAGGALVAFLAALAGANVFVQLVLFFVVSLVLLFFTRPWAARYFNTSRVKTNAESLIGQIGIVEKTINNIEASGTVEINGQQWTARTEENSQTIEAGAKVEVLEIQGVKLIVKEKKTEE